MVPTRRRDPIDRPNRAASNLGCQRALLQAPRVGERAHRHAGVQESGRSLRFEQVG